MTQFKEGDEVLVKAKFLCGREDAVLTFDYEIDGYFAPCVKDLIPASALDVNKELLAENERFRNNQSILITSFRINMMRLCPDYSHEEFDKDIADMLKEKE